ncbi:MAG: hypothetical protein IPL71_16440 [Anaerolineales bacterium]|uniref:hypothetical protein n=1 Tax=Candidatus Villigracilis proximus TaxID=3140683 RepID=UPI0031350F7C|nr:hypothetical protein [Anaerolineales bacterium]
MNASIVDVHALTTWRPLKIRQNTMEMAQVGSRRGCALKDSIIFVQSHVPQVMELHTYAQW